MYFIDHALMSILDLFLIRTKKMILQNFALLPNLLETMDLYVPRLHFNSSWGTRSVIRLEPKNKTYWWEHKCLFCSISHKKVLEEQNTPSSNNFNDVKMVSLQESVIVCAESWKRMCAIWRQRNYFSSEDKRVNVLEAFTAELLAVFVQVEILFHLVYREFRNTREQIDSIFGYFNSALEL